MQYDRTLYSIDMSMTALERSCFLLSMHTLKRNEKGKGRMCVERENTKPENRRLTIRKEKLSFERIVSKVQEQIIIEGEATLQGSMRDAITVLGIQAQAHITGIKPGMDEALAKGRVQFQALYTQGDLTRIRTLETSCDFECTLAMEGVTPGMRVNARAAIQETQGSAASGRMRLRAVLDIMGDARESMEREWIADAQDQENGENLQKRMQTINCCMKKMLGEGKTLVRQEFELPARLGATDVLNVTATGSAEEFSGGNGRIGVSGTIQVRTLHRPIEAGNPLVTVQHELPYDLTIDAQLPQGQRPHATVEIMDVMADCIQSGDARILRIEADARVVLYAYQSDEYQLLEDAYSLSGPAIEPVRETMSILSNECTRDVQESLRLQVTIAADAPPMDTVLAAMAFPTIAEIKPSGRRLDVSGIMSVTLIYLPIDSDIPCSIHSREPFAMMFPVEAGAAARAQAYTIEATPGPATSDRAEVRCVLGLYVEEHEEQLVHGVVAAEETPQEKQERGFVIVWPAEGETKWDTARRLRVAQESLKPAGGRALLAFRK